MSELNRRGRRTKHEGTGRVHLGMFRSLPCTIADISNSGARLGIDESVDIPDSFHLKISGYRRKLKAETRWRKGGEVGVEFTLE